MSGHPLVDYSTEAIAARAASILNHADGLGAGDVLEIDGVSKSVAVWLWEHVHATELPAGYSVRYRSDSRELDVRGVFAISEHDARRRRAARENQSWRQLPSGLWEKRCAGPCGRWRVDTSAEWPRTSSGNHNAPRCRTCQAAMMRERRAAGREVRMGYRISLVSPHDGRAYLSRRPDGRLCRTACELPKLFGVDVRFGNLNGRSGASTWRALGRMELMLGTVPTGSPLSDDNVGRACRQLAEWARSHPDGIWRVELIDRIARLGPLHPPGRKRA